MHGHHDSDHYDVQFTTRQLVLLFGLLIVIVVGVFVGGIVIGRGMAPDAAEAMMAARRSSPVPAPPPAKAAPAAIAEAPDRLARQHLGEYHPLTGMFERLGYDSDSEHSDSESTVDGGAPPEPDADHDVARTMQDEINVDDARGRPEFN